MDRTTKKLCGLVHGKQTLQGYLLAHPVKYKMADLFDKAMEVVKNNLAANDLDAAKFVCNHHLGMPKQKTDHSNDDGSLKPVIPIIVQDQKTADLVKKVMNGTLKRE